MANDLVRRTDSTAEKIKVTRRRETVVNGQVIRTYTCRDERAISNSTFFEEFQYKGFLRLALSYFKRLLSPPSEISSKVSTSNGNLDIYA